MWRSAKQKSILLCGTRKGSVEENFLIPKASESPKQGFSEDMREELEQRTKYCKKRKNRKKHLSVSRHCWHSFFQIFTRVATPEPFFHNFYAGMVFSEFLLWGHFFRISTRRRFLFLSAHLGNWTWRPLSRIAGKIAPCTTESVGCCCRWTDRWFSLT